MKNRKWNRLLLVIIVVSLLVTLCGCQERSTNQTDVMNIGDMKDAMDVRENARIEALQNLKSDLDRQYGDGRAFKDYSETTAVLNDMYKTKLESQLHVIEDAEGFVKCNNVYFNDVLDKVNAGEMTYEEILDDQENNIKNLDVTIYLFVESEDQLGLNIDLQHKMSKFRKDNMGGLLSKYNYARQHKWLTRIYRKELLKTYTLKELESADNVDLLLKASKNETYISYMRDFHTEGWESQRFKEVEDDLEAAYGEDFAALLPLDFGGVRNFACAPASDLTQVFEYDSVRGSNYLSHLLEKPLNNRIEEIVKQHGAEGKIVQLNFPEKIISNKDNLKGITGEELMKSEDFEVQTLTSFYYLKTPDEEIDYETIIEIMKNVKSHNTENFKNGMFMFFYEVNEADRKIITHLFKNMGSIQTKLEPEATIFKLETLYVVDANNDAFNYLYTHGKKLDGILDVHRPITTDNVDAFVEKYTRDGIWR